MTTAAAAPASSGPAFLRDNWRPISALLLATLPLLRALGLAPGLTEETFTTALEVIGLVLGLYVAGRSAEKVTALVGETKAATATAQAVAQEVAAEVRQAGAAVVEAAQQVAVSGDAMAAQLRGIAR